MTDTVGKLWRFYQHETLTLTRWSKMGTCCHRSPRTGLRRNFPDHSKRGKKVSSNIIYEPGKESRSLSETSAVS